MNQAIKYEYEYSNYNNTNNSESSFTQDGKQKEHNAEVIKLADNFIHFCSTLAAIERRLINQ